MVQLSGPRDQTENTVGVRWVPTLSWVQNLCLTPCYANQLKTFTETAASDWTVHCLDSAQSR